MGLGKINEPTTKNWKKENIALVLCYKGLIKERSFTFLREYESKYCSKLLKICIFNANEKRSIVSTNAPGSVTFSRCTPALGDQRSAAGSSLLSRCPHMVARQRKDANSLLSLLSRVLMLSGRLHSPALSTSQRPHLHHMVLSIRISMYEFWGYTACCQKHWVKGHPHFTFW